MAAAPPVLPGKQTATPPGVILAYLGAEPPTGWLLCYGQDVAKADYPALHGLCGTRFGVGTSTTFTLPDLRGRVIAGQDDMGGTSANRLSVLDGDVLGIAGGEESPNANTASDLTTGGSTSYVTSIASGSAIQPTMVLNYIVKT